MKDHLIAVIGVVVVVVALSKVGVLAQPPTYQLPFDTNFYVNWGRNHTSLVDGGYVMNLQLDNYSGGAGFQSKEKYVFGYSSMKIKLVPGNSAGVVVAYYMMSNPMETRDEFDFEFLGNVSGQPWICQTNIFTGGMGGREERIYLWFNPSLDFHTYSILWNDQQIVFYVDDHPIRVYRNDAITVFRYPKNQGMSLYSSIWNGDQWATRGGLDKINWTYAPFITSYNKFIIEGCVYGDQLCLQTTQSKWWNQLLAWRLSPEEQAKYTWVRTNFMVYDYCKDTLRYPVPFYDCASLPW